jgi:hypothetical protein
MAVNCQALRTVPAVRGTRGSQSRGDVILADISGFSDVIVCMPPRMWLNSLVNNDRGSQAAWL